MKLQASRAFNKEQVLSFRLTALLDKLKGRQSSLSAKAMASAPIKKDLAALGAVPGSFKVPDGKNTAGKHLRLDALPEDLLDLVKGIFRLY